MEAKDVADAFSSDIYAGISPAEAQRRKRKNRGTVWFVRRASAGEYALACFSDFASILLVVTAAFAALFEGGISAVALCVLLAVGAALRVGAYVKARRILENCAAENEPTAVVLRGGKLLPVRAASIVPGDIVFLESGDTVPADGRMATGEDLAISERDITENRDTIHKNPAVIHVLHRPGTPEQNIGEGGEVPAEFRANMLYAGSTVLRGEGRMIVTATGRDTLICRKQGGIQLTSVEKLPFMDALERFCQLSSLCMLALALVFTAAALLTGAGFSRVFLLTMAMAVASMSEFLPALAYSIIAISVRKCGESLRTSGSVRTGGSVRTADEPMSQRGAVITNIAAVETLANVKRLVFSDMDLLRGGDTTLHAFWSNGRFSLCDAESRDGGIPGSAGRIAEAELLLRLMLATVGANGTEQSLTGAGGAALSRKYRAVSRAAECSAQWTGKRIHAPRAMDYAGGKLAAGLDTALIEDGGEIWAVVSGGIAEVLQCAVSCWDGHAAVPLTEELRRSICTEAARMTVMGGYVIAAARRVSPYTTLNRLPLLQSNMCFMGFIALVTPPEDGARELLNVLRHSGFSVAALSEDTELDLYYGREIGLFTRKSPVYPLSFAGTPPLPSVKQDCIEQTENCLIGAPTATAEQNDPNARRSSVRYERLKSLLRATKAQEKKETAELRAARERYLTEDAAWKARHRRFFRDATSPAQTENDPDPAKEETSDVRPTRVPAVLPQYGTTAVICRSVMDARLLTTGEIGIAVGASPNRPIPQPLKAKADAVAYPPSGNGGITETVEILCAARRAMMQIHAAAVYLLISQAARLAFSLLCAVFGSGLGASLPSPAMILLWGLILDFLAALTIAFRKPGNSEEVLSCTAAEMGLPGKRDILFRIPTCGVVWGASCAALYPLLHGFTNADATGIVVGAMFLCQCAVAGAFSWARGTRRFHVAWGAFALLILALFWISLAQFTGPLWYAAFAVLPPVLTCLAVSLCRKK